MERRPLALAGQSVGLLGGSFDPPHSGHVHITRHALRRFELDRIWWLVSPGNPLKVRGPAPLQKRIKACERIMQHPRVEVTDIEARLGTHVTAKTLAVLLARYPGVRFVWLMGADNLANFHKWRNWRWIMNNVPIGVLARPGDRLSARMSPAARLYAPYRIPGNASQLLARASAPSWCFVNVPMIDQSSTRIRAEGRWIKATHGDRNYD